MGCAEDQKGRDLCETFFEIKLGVAAYTHKPVTQKTIDRLPPMVRLANEQKIKDLGFQPKITESLRTRCANNKTMEKEIPEDVYDGAVNGSVSFGVFFRLNGPPRREK